MTLRQAFEQGLFAQSVLILPRGDFLALGGREFGIGNDDTIRVFAKGFGFGAENNIEDFLNFEGGLGLRGPETILGRNELGEDDCLPDVFGDFCCAMYEIMSLRFEWRYLCVVLDALYLFYILDGIFGTSRNKLNKMIGANTPSES